MTVQTKVNINTAGREELQQIEGLDSQLADEIVRFRDRNGDYKSIENLRQVPGIDSAKFEVLKYQITVSGGLR